VRNRAPAASLCYKGWSENGAAEMDFIRSMQSRDWMIAAVAFVAGAIIF
jgi:hypothetical protein